MNVIQNPFQQRFKKIGIGHSHQTRKLTKINDFLPRVFKMQAKKIRISMRQTLE